MNIIFDSNIWIEELGLNSGAASAAKFFIKKKNIQVVLPEVVELEVTKNLNDKLNTFISLINNNYRQLLTVFGELKSIKLPKEEEVKEKIKKIFTESNLNIINYPFTFESAKDSFLKTINKVPPSDKQQQFKDGVLWADCVVFLKKNDLIFVTSVITSNII